MRVRAAGKRPKRPGLAPQIKGPDLVVLGKNTVPAHRCMHLHFCRAPTFDFVCMHMCPGSFGGVRVMRANRWVQQKFAQQPHRETLYRNCRQEVRAGVERRWNYGSRSREREGKGCTTKCT